MNSFLFTSTYIPDTVHVASWLIGVLIIVQVGI